GRPPRRHAAGADRRREPPLGLGLPTHRLDMAALARGRGARLRRRPEHRRAPDGLRQHRPPVRVHGLSAMRRLAVLGVIVGVLVLAALYSFPTDELVRQAVARLSHPGGPTLVFRRAVLRPWGLRLDEVAWRSPDGTALAAADWVRVRPSPWGLLHLDYLGRPWAVFAGLCQGTIDASVDPQPTSLAVTASWQNLHLDDRAGLAPTDLAW